MRPGVDSIIGDPLDTDIAGGVQAGLTTVLVLSGIATEADLAASLVKPDQVYADIGELVQMWQASLQDPIRAARGGAKGGQLVDRLLESSRKERNRQ